MRTGVLQFPTAPPNRCSHEFSNRRNNSSTNIASTSTSTSMCCFSTKNGGRTGGSKWDRSTWSSRDGTKYQDEFFTYDYDDEEEGFGFRNTAKRRTWWCDDDSLSWDEEEDDDDDESIGGFGILEGAIGFSWIFKLFRAFGWMVPAVIVSMLIGTGTNGFVMALALPLAQSALSLIFDALWGRSTDRARPKSRRRKSAFSGGARNKKTRTEREQNSSQSDRMSDAHQSWEAANNASSKKGKRRTHSFGGWDELDKDRITEEEPITSTSDGRRQQTEGKLNRRARNRKTPLFVRLLIAFFPFLGSWTKLL